MITDDLSTYEKALIGCTMLDWEQAQQVKPLLSPTEFADGQCRDYWELFCHAANIDEYLEVLNKSQRVTFASACMDTNIPMSMIPWVASKIKQAARKRRLQTAVAGIWQSGEDPLEGLAQLVNEEQKRAATQENNDLPAQLHAATVAEMRRNDLSQRISTGIDSIDRIVQGFRPGNVSVLGAEPSTGKTAFALNVAVKTLSRGKSVLIFSLEMSATQMMDRMISSTSNIPYADINNKTLPESYMELFEKVSFTLTKDNLLYIYDTVYSVEQMGSVIAQVKPALVIVDFLQFCRTETKGLQNTADKLEYIVSEFKRLAKVSYHPCHIMLLSQPSRQATRDGASMFALKGSSGIEQGGDVILLLDRPAVRDQKYPQEQAIIKVAKNKFGYVGTVSIYFEGAFQRFRDLAPGEFFPPVTQQEDKPW